MTKETCGYCSHFEFGYCVWRLEKRKSDQEICEEVKKQKK